MLRLTKKTDYALMAICHIAASDGGRVISAKEISEEFNIPNQLLAKILQKLAKKGLITSSNGPKGGYILAKNAEEITVTQVIRAIEGPIGLLDCYHEERPQCEHLSQCTIRTPMRQVQETVIDALDQMTLKNVSRSMAPFGGVPRFETERQPLLVQEETRSEHIALTYTHQEEEIKTW
jgi:Rrf2 family protein